MRRLSLLVLACAFAACSGSPADAGGRVEYRVIGFNVTRVSLTYSNANGGTSQIASQTLPWSYSWTGARSGDFLYVSAQIVEGNGNVTATITANGQQVQTATSSGFAAIATASGSF
jgi:hypothetical protein